MGGSAKRTSVHVHNRWIMSETTERIVQAPVTGKPDTGGTYINRLTTGKGFKNPYESSAKPKMEAAVPVIDETPGGSAVPTQEVVAPEVTPVAPAPEVPTARETSTEAALQTKAPSTPEKKIVKVPKGSLLQLPGEQPKTPEQLQFERTQVKDVVRERELLRVERERLEQEKAEIAKLKAPTERVAQIVTPEAPQFSEPRPQRPKGAIEGDEEYENYKEQVEIWKEKKQEWLAEQTAVRVTTTLFQKQQAKEQQEQALVRQYEENNRVYKDALGRLPFDITQFDADAQQAVQQRLIEVANSRVRPVPLHDQMAMSQAPLHPDTMELIVAEAFPPGSLPPGYEWQDEVEAPEAIQDLPPARVIPGITEPMVAKAPPQPPLPVGGTASPAPRYSERPMTKTQKLYGQLDGKIAIGT